MEEIQEETEEKVEETCRLLNLGEVPVGQDPVGSAEDCVKSSSHLSQELGSEKWTEMRVWRGSQGCSPRRSPKREQLGCSWVCWWRVMGSMSVASPSQCPYSHAGALTPSVTVFGGGSSGGEVMRVQPL